MGGRIEDQLGKQFGLLTVVDKSGVPGLQWVCRCTCGNTKNVSNYHLNKWCVRSCGCLRRRGKTAGMYKTAIHALYRAMLRRCDSPKAANYRFYGAKGIKVCDRWRNSFFDFMTDMGERPSKKHTIDRIDSKGDYTPTNCRWADSYTQNRNKSIVILTPNTVVQIRYVYNRFGYTPKELSRLYGVTPDVIRGVIFYRTWKNLP